MLSVIKFSHAQEQDVDSSKSYKDYQYHLTLYKNFFSDFNNSKSKYLANPTLNLKEDTRLKMFDMLTQRDQLLSVYLAMLKIRITENEGITNEDKNHISSKIDTDIKWYEEDKSRFLISDSLEVLLGKSEESKKRYQTSTFNVIGEALDHLTLGQEITLRVKHQQVFSDLKTMISAGVSSGKFTESPFTHWLEDIEATNQSLMENEDKLRQEILKDRDYSYPRKVCENCSKIFSDSVLSLSRINEFLTEVLNYIDNND